MADGSHFENTEPGTVRVQALADISRSVLCCHSNETRALIANPPNSECTTRRHPLPFPHITSGSVQ